MKTLDGENLKKLFISGANNLYNHYPEVDQLNVFPVPDGDTGMNMNLTMTSGVKEIQNRNDDDIYSIASSFSKGLLTGARGNSGVITSQIFHGFADGLKGLKSASIKQLIDAFVMAKVVAYKAVMKPVEGTILTVIRESSEALKENERNIKSIEELFEYLLQEAKSSLDRTPDLLPVLKEVGVVDSGGAGLAIIIEGMCKAAKGEFVERNSNLDETNTLTSVLGQGQYAGAKLSEDEEGYGYCTQFLLRLGDPDEGKKPFIEKKFQNYLSSHGKSVVLVRDDDIVKVHVHTLQPGQMLNFAQNYGEFVSITIENMSEEHENISHGDKATDMAANIERNRTKKEEDNTPLKPYGIVAVSSGEGLDEMFKELGADVIVSGGQTMNPSTEDFLNAIKKAHAENVFIFPNNSNIVMAASQACEVHGLDGINARVIPSKTIPQGITSIMSFNPEADPEDNFEDMKAALSAVRCGSVTYAIKDTDIDGIHITKDYYMAMKDDKTIVACLKDKKEALVELLKSLLEGEDGLMVTLYAGEDIKADECESLSVELGELFPKHDIECRYGGQPVYSFLVGVEE